MVEFSSWLFAGIVIRPTSEILENTEQSIETLEELEKFLIDITDNIEVILKIIEQTKEFCTNKSINMDLLKEFKFSGY